jgi:hypothetical protein
MLYNAGIGNRKEHVMQEKMPKKPRKTKGPEDDIEEKDLKDVKPGERVTIPAIRIMAARMKVVGRTQLVSNNFSQEAQDQMAEKQRQGSQRGKKGAARPPKDFRKDFLGSLHESTEGWYGFPASSLRQGMVDACRAVGYKMTVAKMGVFVLADGEDKDSGQPLVRIIGGEPEMFTAYVRLADGSPDLKSRGRWKNWQIDLVVEFDADMFGLEDVTNLLNRMGRQVGLGAGRHFSKKSCGQGWGEFYVDGYTITHVPEGYKHGE